MGWTGKEVTANGLLLTCGDDVVQATSIRHYEGNYEDYSAQFNSIVADAENMQPWASVYKDGVGVWVRFATVEQSKLFKAFNTPRVDIKYQLGHVTITNAELGSCTVPVMACVVGTYPDLAAAKAHWEELTCAT